MFRRLIVALVRNCDPTLPPAGSGRFGLVDAADFLMADPFPVALEAFAAMNFLLFDFRCALTLLTDFFVIFNFIIL
jgi:hypothetical protein